jgi:hypothetical protein
MPEEPDDFVTALARAQRLSGDGGSLFAPDGPGRVAFEGNPRRIGPDLEHDAHVAVFNLPTDRGEYEDVLNQVLRGEAALRYEERTFDKDGNFLVAVCYMTPRVRPQPEPGQEAGDAEAPVLPRRIP